MRILAVFLSKHFRQLAKELQEQREITERLEIALRRTTERLHALEGDHEALSERLARVAGRLGGRPRNAKGRTVEPEGEQLDIEDIPKGDKQALRRALGVGVVKPTRPTNQE